MSISLFALSGILISLSSGFMAIVMFALGRTRLHLLWGAFCISVLTWGIGSYLIGTTPDPIRALFWWKMTHIGVAFIPAFFLHFVYVFIKRPQRLVVNLCYLTAGLFAVLAVSTPLLIDHTRLVFGEFYYDSPPGIFYPLFTAYFFAVTILSHVLLYITYKRDSLPQFRLDRIRISYFFLGMLISFAGGSLSFLPVYGIDLYPYGNFAVTLYPLIVGYAILKHHLFDIRAAAAQGLMFLLWIFVGIRVLVSQSPAELLPNALLFISVLILGIVLVRSINKEISQRETVMEQQQALQKANEEVYKHSVELVKLQKELKEANAKQENLLHFISHEVKGYLTRSMAAFSGIADGDYGTVSPEAKGLAEAALAETRKGVETVMDILDAGNFKKGTLKLEHKPFDLKASLETSVTGLRKAAADKHLVVRVAIAPGDYNLIGDEPQMRKHVIDNLIQNAINYTQEGEIVVSLSSVEGKLRLSVKDSGIGLSDEDKAHLFTEGGRGAESIQVNVHSTGYGLYIAKSIVLAHSGRIWAESPGRNKGSTFVVELPAA